MLRQGRGGMHRRRTRFRPLWTCPRMNPRLCHRKAWTNPTKSAAHGRRRAPPTSSGSNK